MCGHILNPCEKKNQRVNINDRVTRTYFPLTLRQTHVEFEIFSSLHESNEYWTPQMKKVGVMEIKLPPYQKVEDCPVEVKVAFGGTEVTITAKQQKTKEKISCSINFIFNTK